MRGRIMQIEEGVIRRSRRLEANNTDLPRSAYLHIIRKPNSIIVSLFFQNISMAPEFNKAVTENY